MLSLIGNGLLVCSLVASLACATLLAAGIRGGRERLVNAGYLLAFGTLAALTCAIAIILVCFVTENYSLAYVASNFPQDSSPLAILYRVSGVWAGRQGSLLFWTWLISLFTASVAWRRMRATDDLSSAAIAVAQVVTALFTAALVLSDANNPFVPTAAELLAADGSLAEGVTAGMNPLLLHWAMVLHPPATFIGYAGCTIPFAYAIAALAVGDLSARWVELSDRVAVFSFIFLTIGMALGAVWAYVVLGWGGFWAWDAVENASLMSWLAAIAMVHSFTMYRRRGHFKRWSMLSATATFIFVVLGTFITRSGLVQSVHAFAEDPVSTYFFLGIMVAAGLAFLILVVYRSGEIDDADELESLASKGGTYYITDLVCIVGACLVAYLTCASALPDWLPLGGQAVQAGVYNAVARPATALFGLMMAVCPLLGWSRTEGAAFWRNFRVPAAIGAVVFAGLMAYLVLRLAPDYAGIMAAGGDTAELLAEQGPVWYYLGLAGLSFLAASLLLAVSAYLICRGVRGRMRAQGENPLVALVNLFRRSPAQAGGYLAHLGCALALVGLVGAGMFVHDETVALAGTVGESVEVAGYELTLEGTSDTFDDQDDRVMQVELSVADAASGSALGAVSTSVEVSAATQQQTLHAGVLGFPTEDLFVAFQGLNADGTLSVNVKVNPLIGALWAGGAVTVAGIAFAAIPRRATPLITADERDRAKGR